MPRPKKVDANSNAPAKINNSQKKTTSSTPKQPTANEMREWYEKNKSTMMNVHPKTEKAKGKTTKHWMLQEDRMKVQQSEDKKGSSTLLPLVSACINHPGFKYKLDDLKQVNICQFMDSVQRIQKYEQGVAAMHGIYGGMVSAKDIPNDLINFMSDL